MAEIIPAIIGGDFAEVREKIRRLQGLVTWAQLDIMDGIFTPEYSWQNSSDLENLDSRLRLEAHLMVSEPENIIDDWLKVCNRLIIHIESTVKLEQILERIKLNAAVAVLALRLETPLEKLAPYAGQAQTIQLMSIATIGHYGEPLDSRIFERIKLLRAIYPNVKIAVDGGVTGDNTHELIAAGADRLVVGSAIWQAPVLEEAIDALRRQN